MRTVTPCPCLLIPRIYRWLFEILNSPIERVAEGWNFRFDPSLYQSLRFCRFESGVCNDWREFMTDGMTANFVPPLDHALETLDVACIPFDLAPPETTIRECGVGISDQEESGWKAVLVKEGGWL